MLVVGLVGGIASGKSFVAECFKKLGAAMIDADRIGHEALEMPHVFDSVSSKWPEVIAEDSTVDRKKLAKIVFDPVDGGPQLDKLESILHPEIEMRMEKMLSKFKADGKQVVIIDAPVLLKAGWQNRCSRILFVDSPLELRVARAIDRGWDSTELLQRESQQTTLQEKRLIASDIIFNEGTKEQTRDQVLRVWNSWLRLN